MPDSKERIVVVPIPPLVTQLEMRERDKGAPLIDSEVFAARDNAVCITMSEAHAAAFAAKRGFDDIDPENVWVEWQQHRGTSPNSEN